MSLIRLIQKRFKRGIINNLIGKFDYILESLILSHKPNVKIKSVEYVFTRNTNLANKGEIIKLKPDVTISSKILRKGEIDNYICKFVIKRMQNKKNYIFIDVGANQGLITKQLIKEKKINYFFCFEPNKENVEILKNNLNRYKNYQVLQYGLGDKNIKKASFYEHILNSGNLSLLNREKQKFLNKSFVKIKYASTEIKRIINLKKKFNLIYKSDCQGFDEIIFNCFDSFILNKMDIVILEISNFKFIKKNKDLLYDKISAFKKKYIDTDFIKQHNTIIEIKSLNELDNIFNKRKEFNLFLSKY